MPLGRREVYRYLDACAPSQADVTVLSVADRLATRGDNSERAIARHLELARQLLGEALAWAADPPRPPIRGDELVAGARDPARAAARRAAARTRGGGLRRRGLLARGGDRLRPPAEPSAGKLPAMSDPDCLFCKIVAGELPAQIVDEDELTVAFMDINPATRGHALVVPRKHSTQPARGRARGSDRDHAAQPSASRRRVTERLGADGVNLLNSCGSAAWQTVFHLHVHVIPQVRRRSAEAPVDPGPGRPGRDRGGRRAAAMSRARGAEARWAPGR